MSGALLAPQPNVPHVLTAEVRGEAGCLVVCLPDDDPAALVQVERNGMRLHTAFAEGGLRACAAALLEAADRLNDRDQRGNEGPENPVKSGPTQVEMFP